MRRGFCIRQRCSTAYSSSAFDEALLFRSVDACILRDRVPPSSGSSEHHRGFQKCIFLLLLSSCPSHRTISMAWGDSVSMPSTSHARTQAPELPSCPFFCGQSGEPVVGEIPLLHFTGKIVTPMATSCANARKKRRGAVSSYGDYYMYLHDQTFETSARISVGST